MKDIFILCRNQESSRWRSLLQFYRKAIGIVRIIIPVYFLFLCLFIRMSRMLINWNLSQADKTFASLSGAGITRPSFLQLISIPCSPINPVFTKAWFYGYVLLENKRSSWIRVPVDLDLQNLTPGLNPPVGSKSAVTTTPWCQRGTLSH